eukprot:3941023-Rhodomonas_salina.2
MASEQADGKDEEKIDVTLPDGTVFAGTKGKTSAWDVAASISKGLADNAVAAMVRSALLAALWKQHSFESVEEKEASPC